MNGLRLVGAGTTVLVDTPLATLGRSPSCRVVLPDGRVSGTHGRLSWDGQWLFEDLDSTNGSLVRRPAGDTAVVPGTPVPLEDGDVLLLGDVADPVVLQVEVLGPPSEARAPAQVTIVASRAAVAPAPRVLDPVGTSELLEVLRTLASAPGSAEGVLRRVATFLFERCPSAHLLALEMAAGDAAPTPLAIWRGDNRCSPGAPIPALLRRRALEQGEVLLATDLQPAGHTESVAALGITTALVAPLRVRDQAVGILLLGGGPTGPSLSEQDLDTFAVVAHHTAALVENARLVATLERTADHLRVENRRLRDRGAPAGLVGDSATIASLLEQVHTVARTKTTVLLQGETGTGKELLARAVHDASPRAAQPMLTVNCGALASGVLESELFGHVKGAFTGAHRDKPGLFEVADGGTLFLDEVGEMSAELQVRLLRVLQEAEVHPVGATKTRPIDVRIVCATNRDLAEEVAAGRFREDLFYRLSVFPIRVPPLRERRGDVAVLSRHFLAEFGADLGKSFAGLSAEALDAMAAWDWPGNVRELRNEIERAALLAPADGVVGLEHLSPRLRSSPALPAVGPLKSAMAQVEAAYLAKALQSNNGNRSATARSLGISRQALLAKIQRYGLD